MTCIDREMRNDRRRNWWEVGLCLILVYGCGGGGGNSASLPPPPFSVSAFSPASGLPNSSITVQGSSLTKVTAVTIGGGAATIAASTDSQLTVTVPASPISGTVTLKWGRLFRPSARDIYSIS